MYIANHTQADASYRPFPEQDSNQDYGRKIRRYGRQETTPRSDPVRDFDIPSPRSGERDNDNRFGESKVHQNQRSVNPLLERKANDNYLQVVDQFVERKAISSNRPSATNHQRPVDHDEVLYNTDPVVQRGMERVNNNNHRNEQHKTQHQQEEEDMRYTDSYQPERQEVRPRQRSANPLGESFNRVANQVDQFERKLRKTPNIAGLQVERNLDDSFSAESSGNFSPRTFDPNIREFRRENEVRRIDSLLDKRCRDGRQISDRINEASEFMDVATRRPISESGLVRGENLLNVHKRQGSTADSEIEQVDRFGKSDIHTPRDFKPKQAGREQVYGKRDSYHSDWTDESVTDFTRFQADNDTTPLKFNAKPFGIPQTHINLAFDDTMGDRDDIESHSLSPYLIHRSTNPNIPREQNSARSSGEWHINSGDKNPNTGNNKQKPSQRQIRPLESHSNAIPEPQQFNRLYPDEIHLELRASESYLNAGTEQFTRKHPGGYNYPVPERKGETNNNMPRRIHKNSEIRAIEDLDQAIDIGDNSQSNFNTRFNKANMPSNIPEYFTIYAPSEERKSVQSFRMSSTNDSIKETNDLHIHPCMIVLMLVSGSLIIWDVIMDWMFNTNISSWSCKANQKLHTRLDVNINNSSLLKVCTDERNLVELLITVMTSVGTLVTILQLVNISVNIIGKLRGGSAKGFSGLAELQVAIYLREIPQVLLALFVSYPCDCGDDANIYITLVISSGFLSSLVRYVTSFESLFGETGFFNRWWKCLCCRESTHEELNDDHGDTCFCDVPCSPCCLTWRCQGSHCALLCWCYELIKHLPCLCPGCRKDNEQYGLRIMVNIGLFLLFCALVAQIVILV